MLYMQRLSESTRSIAAVEEAVHAPLMAGRVAAIGKITPS